MSGSGPIYEWSRCVGHVNGCKRRSRTFPPHVQWICGRCYRSAPKSLRDLRTKANRKKAQVRNPARKMYLEGLAGRTLERIFDVVRGRSNVDGDDMPPMMVEQLRKDGLL